MAISASGAVVAIGAAGEKPDVRVGGFGQSIAQAMVEGVVEKLDHQEDDLAS